MQDENDKNQVHLAKPRTRDRGPQTGGARDKNRDTDRYPRQRHTPG